MDNQLTQTKTKLIKYLRDLEESKRKDKKRWLNEFSYKVGRLAVQRLTNKSIDYWEEGEEIIKYKNRLNEIHINQNDLDKEIKKEIANSKKLQIKELIDKNYEEQEKKELVNYKMQLLSKVQKII